MSLQLRRIDGGARAIEVQEMVGGAARNVGRRQTNPEAGNLAQRPQNGGSSGQDDVEDRTAGSVLSSTRHSTG